MRNDSYDNDNMNAIQRERMERRRNTRRKSMLTTGVFVGAGVLLLAGIITAAVLALGGKDNNPTVAPTTVTATIASEAKSTGATTATQGATQSSQQTGQNATLPPQALSTDAPVVQTSTEAANQTPASTSENDSYINDDNVYIDRNHPAPQNTGSSIDYSVYGAVSGNFYWNYSADNGNCTVACDYDFTNQMYIFHIYGASPGTCNLSLYYSDNGVTNTASMALSIDSNLNVTQIG